MKNLVDKQFEKSNTDTANFYGRFIAFNDSIDDNYQKEWYVNTTLINLVHQNKLKIIDKQGTQVSRVTTKRVGSKKKGFVVRYYMIKNTEEILFFRLIYEVLEVPRF